MSYRLSQFVTALNAALNYPAVTYDDVALYMDMCIGEINTSLHTSLRSIGDCRNDLRERAMSESAPIVLDSEPTGANAAVHIAHDQGDLLPNAWQYWDAKDSRYRKFVRTDASGNVDSVRESLFGVYVSEGVAKVYEAHMYSGDLCLWIATDGYSDLNLSDYLTDDWITLFMVPYVCFKYTVRDGGTASTFAEEFEQGFQQLQESYDVPEDVVLSKVAGMPAYAKDVKDRLDSGKGLDGRCPTRAITESMKHPRAVNAQYGSMHDAGGWGL